LRATPKSMTQQEFEQELMRQAADGHAKLLAADQLNANIAETTREINNIFQSHDVTDRIHEADISFNFDTLTDKLTSIKTDDGIQIRRSRRFSDIIFNHYNGRVANTTTYYHYTSFSSFENILRQKELRLYSMAKRFSQGEYNQFYVDHDLRGIGGDSTNPTIKQLLNEIFYISFARASELTKDYEDDLWRSFADDGMGVRLEFDIRAKYRDFRNIHYNDPSKKKSELLFNALKDRIRELYEKKLVFAGLAKIGCFYLPGDFDTEYETRLLIKKHTDEYDFKFQIHTDNALQFIKLPFESQIADIKLLSVKPGYCVESDSVKAVLDQYPLNHRPTILERAKFTF